MWSGKNYSFYFFLVIFFSVTSLIRTEAQTGHALFLDGLNNYAEVPDNASFDFSDSLTIEAWIKPLDVAGQHIIAGKSWCFQSDYGYNFYIEDGKIYFDWSASGNCNFVGIYRTNFPVVNALTCSHVAVVFSSSEVKIYVNGALVPGSLMIGTYSQIHNSSAPFKIGSYKGLDGSFASFWNGEVDEVRIWSRKLSGSEINARMNSPLTGNESGLIAYYDMEENGSGNGFTISNKCVSTGSALNALSVGSGSTPYHTNISCATTSSSNALHFDGVNDRIYIGNSPLFNPVHITLQAWIKADYAGAYRAVVTKRNCCGGSVEQWTMQTEAGRMHFHANTDNIPIFITDPNPLPLNTWTNYTATYDGETAILYKNGTAIVIDQTPSGNITPMSWPVYIGDRDGGNDWWPGAIDEVRIWDRALTQQEILANMNCHLDGSEPGLIAYYDFNQGIPGGNNTGLIMLPDLTSHGLNGTLQNFSLNGNTSNWVASGFTDVSVSVLTQPNNVHAYLGDTAKFIITQSNTSASLQWQVDTGFGFQNLTDILQFSGANNDTLTVSSITFSNNNYLFRCFVSLPGYCSDTSAVALLTVSNTQPYIFIGTGNWDVASNWINDIIPPDPLPANYQIRINPAGTTECILNVPQTIAAGASIIILPGKRFNVANNLTIQ